MHNIFADKNEKYIVFDKIAIFYGNNACGKSSLLNIITNKFNLIGSEMENMKYFYDFKKNVRLNLINRKVPLATKCCECKK